MQIRSGVIDTAVPMRAASMNIWSVTALGIGAMVGAGIFAVLGQVALLAGASTWLAFLLGGVIAALSGYSYAKLAIRYPEAGGVSAYFDQAFGTGGVSGSLSLIYMVTVAVTIALVAKAFGAYAAPLILGHASALWAAVFSSGIIVVLAVMNLSGAALVGKMEIVLVAIKLVILTALMVAGAAALQGKPAIAQFHPGAAVAMSYVGLTFLAYAGFDNTANAASSVRNPARTIPLAMMLAIGVVVILYVGLALVVLASLSPAELALHADIVVAEAARPILGQAGFVIVSIGALLATASGINAWIFNGMNIALSLAKTGQLPRLFSHMVWRKGSLGLLASLGAILLAVNVLQLGALANVASAAFLIIYLAVHVAHWRLVADTGGSKPIVIAGILSMSLVLAAFLWSTAHSQPWSVAATVLFLGVVCLSEGRHFARIA